MKFWNTFTLDIYNESLPLRERGLKLMSKIKRKTVKDVAPLAGAWIEMLWLQCNIFSFRVAPLAGAWIEILRLSFSGAVDDVAPLAGAWIEIAFFTSLPLAFRVAPLAGAWIEMLMISSIADPAKSRSPCGSVD